MSLTSSDSEDQSTPIFSSDSEEGGTPVFSSDSEDEISPPIKPYSFHTPIHALLGEGEAAQPPIHQKSNTLYRDSSEEDEAESDNEILSEKFVGKKQTTGQGESTSSTSSDFSANDLDMGHDTHHGMSVGFETEQPTQDTQIKVPNEQTPLGASSYGETPILDNNLRIIDISDSTINLKEKETAEISETKEQGLHPSNVSSTSFENYLAAEEFPILTKPIRDYKSYFASLATFLESTTSENVASSESASSQGDVSDEQINKAKNILKNILSSNLEALIHPSRTVELKSSINTLRSARRLTPALTLEFKRLEEEVPILLSNFETAMKNKEQAKQQVEQKGAIRRRLEKSIKNFAKCFKLKDSISEETKNTKAVIAELQARLVKLENEDSTVDAKLTKLTIVSQKDEETLRKLKAESSMVVVKLRKSEGEINRMKMLWAELQQLNVNDI